MVVVEEKKCQRCQKIFSTYNEEIIHCTDCRNRKKSNRFEERDKRKHLKIKAREQRIRCKGCLNLFTTTDKRRVYCENCRIEKKLGYKRNCKYCQKEFTTFNKNFLYCENHREKRKGKVRKIRIVEKEKFAFHLCTNYNVSYYEAIEIVDALSKKENLIEFIDEDNEIIENNLISFIEEHNIIEKELKKCF